MQRLPDHVRDMLSTRNPSDNWIKYMVNPDFADGQQAAQSEYGLASTSEILLRIATCNVDYRANGSEFNKGYLYGLARCLVNALKPSEN